MNSAEVNNQEDNHQDMNFVMSCVMEHFITHHKVVLQKLHHAQEATSQSIKEIKEELPEKANPKLAEVQKYDVMWAEIIETFRIAGITEDELKAIDGVLDGIPKIIKKFYDLLIEQDKALQEMMSELQSDKYEKAFKIVHKVQGKPDPLSNLPPSEFKSAKPHAVEKSFLIRQPGGKAAE